jgi:hypothetical protein
VFISDKDLSYWLINKICKDDNRVFFLFFLIPIESHDILISRDIRSEAVENILYAHKRIHHAKPGLVEEQKAKNEAVEMMIDVEVPVISGDNNLKVKPLLPHILYEANKNPLIESILCLSVVSFL